MGNGVMVVAEASGGALRPVSLELVSAARKVAAGIDGPVKALLIGQGLGSAAEQLAGSGVDEVLVADDPRLAGATAEALTAVGAAVVADEQPAVVLVPITTAGSDLAPRLSARLGVPLAADAVDLGVEDGGLVVTRPVLGDRMLAAVKLAGVAPMMVTVRVGSFEKAATDGGAAPITVVPVELGPDDLRVSVLGLEQISGGATRLEDSDVVVAGGRGLKEPANFALVEQLAEVLGGAVAATRAVVDAGWRPHEEQIGQTGRTIAPRLYIAIGVSGAVQHNVGMQGSEHIVAINRDPDAPIFKLASFGIVGDVFEVVPALIAELKGRGLGVRG